LRSNSLSSTTKLIGTRAGFATEAIRTNLSESVFQTPRFASGSATFEISPTRMQTCSESIDPRRSG